MEPLVLPSRAQRDAAFTLTVIERTRRLRQLTIARHLARAPAHLTGPLDELLRHFATNNTLGVTSAFHYCDWQWGDDIDDEDLDPQLDEHDFSGFHIFAWGPITVAMLLVRLGRDGPIALEVASGLAAAGDRAQGFIDEDYLLEPADDTVLPELFDMLAGAYAIGAAVALDATRRRPDKRRPAPSGEDGWLARATSAIARLAPVEQALLHARYSQRLSADEISAAWIANGASKRRWSAEAMPGSIAGVLTTAHAWMGKSARVTPRAPRRR